MEEKRCISIGVRFIPKADIVQHGNHVCFVPKAFVESDADADVQLKTVRSVLFGFTHGQNIG